MKDLTRGNIYKTFFLFGLPLVLSGLLSQTYHVIDTMIAGRFLGDRGLAAMGATSPLLSFLSSVFWGYSAGFSIYVARLFGAGEYKKIKSAMYTTFLILLAACVLLAVVMLVFHEQTFDLLQIEEDLHDDAFEYFLYYVLGLFFIIGSSVGVHLTTALGIGSFPFFMSLVSALLNVAGNLLTVLVLGWGIKGLAISTVFSAAVVDLFYVLKFLSCLKEMGVKKERAEIRFSSIKNSLPFALPNSLQQSVMYLAGMLISPLVNSLGVAATASYSVVSRVYDINASVYQNSARSVSNYSAQCVGHGETEKLGKGVWVGLLQGIAFVTPFLLFCTFFPQLVCSLFFKADATAETKAYAYLFARNFLPFLYFNLICNLFHGFFRGVKATGHLFGTTCFATIVRYVASVLLIPVWGMEGFFWGWAFSWIAEAVICFLLYFLGRWKKALP